MSQAYTSTLKNFRQRIAELFLTRFVISTSHSETAGLIIRDLFSVVFPMSLINYNMHMYICIIDFPQNCIYKVHPISYESSLHATFQQLLRFVQTDAYKWHRLFSQKEEKFSSMRIKTDRVESFRIIAIKQISTIFVTLSCQNNIIGFVNCWLM